MTLEIVSSLFQKHVLTNCEDVAVSEGVLLEVFFTDNNRVVHISGIIIKVTVKVTYDAAKNECAITKTINLE